MFIIKTVIYGGPKMTYEFFSIIRKAVGGLAVESKYYYRDSSPNAHDGTWEKPC